MSEELQQPKLKPSKGTIVRGANGAHSPQRLASMKRNWMIFRIRGLAKQFDQIFKDASLDPNTPTEEIVYISSVMTRLEQLCQHYDSLRQENLEIRRLEKL